jgi:hypothetical protein
MEFAREQPIEAVKLAGVKITRMWSPMPLSREYGSDRKLLAISLGYMIPFYIVIAAGLWAGPGPKSAKVYLLIPALYFTIVHAISVGSLRYRVPADVPIAVIAAMGAAALFLRFATPAAESPMIKPQ